MAHTIEDAEFMHKIPRMLERIAAALEALDIWLDEYIDRDSNRL